MKKKRKMLKWSFSLFLLIFSTIFADDGYVIRDYKVDIKINDNNVYTISENIDVEFKENRRGIYRVIPEYYNGRTIPITNLEANEMWTSKDNGKYIYLRIGNPDKYIIGNKYYEIKYKYNMGWDRINDYDEVYYNLIGNDWDTNIDKLEFSITLPKNFDSNKINFTLGKYGSTSTQGIVWSVKDNTITGYTTRVLSPGESVTLALPLPEGYFNVNNQKFLYGLLKIVTIILPILLLIISFILYKKYGTNKKIVEVIEFYPPDDMTPTEIGYYIDGRLDSKDFTSMVFYWASKGYLKINVIPKNGIFSKEDFEIEKLKNLESDKSDFQKYLFDALFLYSDTSSKVKLSSLKDKFYTHIQKASKIFEIDIIMAHRELYDEKSLQIGNCMRAFPIFIILTIFGYVWFTGILPIIQIPISIISIAGIFLIASITKRRTEYGENILGRVLGFKRFLITAEKNKLEMLLEENPEYFYDILPYTIVLGVSDKWADKFKDLVTTPPTWYSANDGSFTMLLFMSSFNRSLIGLNQNMLSAPKAPSNYGGGMSSMGGGSSGGGAGGGGGGSW
ncbi:DUF2207 domain-containing protein [Cetobacterium sp. 2A]|nr:DUF2207 domain-containing protein [Cetobacterium sp. 2A]